MIKYKMIAICSLSIVCILILSLLLPLTTSANDKESLELKMHYESSEVTLNIIVNSEVYTGVICKYIMVDDVLTSENLLEQTKQTGTAINLDKNETDTYTTTISNVTTRYVVIYVSIGNCNICDYIDCKPNQEETVNTDTNNSQDENINNENETTVNNENNVSENTDTTEENTNNQTNNESSNTENTENEESNTENNKIENTNTENSNNIQQNTNTQEQTNQEQDKIVVDSNENNNSSEDFEVIEDITPSNEQTQNDENQQQSQEAQNQENQEQQNTNQETQVQENQQQSQGNSNQENPNQEQIAEEVETVQPENEVEQNTTNNNTSYENNQNEQIATEIESTTSIENSKDVINVQNYDKDSVNVNDFEEIEKTTTVTTADGDMPQTGEDDTIKIMGIVIFSIIAGVSFYKYQKTK